MSKEQIFKSWVQTLRNIEKELSKKNGRDILSPEIETLLINPYRMALEAKGILPAPRLGNGEWDKSTAVYFFRTTGKTYRKFWEESPNYEGKTPFRFQFLIYKRYNTELIFEKIPKDARGKKVSGIQGALELLYNPSANIPAEGRRVENTSAGLPLLKKDEQENNPLVGETLTTQRLIPVGKEGFYLFCSLQQCEPQKIFSGRNIRIITGPGGSATRIRAAHLLRILCNGKPEETKKGLLEIEKHCRNFQTKKLRNTLKILDENDILSWTTNALTNAYRNYEIPPKTQNSRNQISLSIAQNTVNTSSGTDYAITLSFGSNTSHERDNESNLINYWEKINSK